MISQHVMYGAKLGRFDRLTELIMSLFCLDRFAATFLLGRLCS